MMNTPETAVEGHALRMVVIDSRPERRHLFRNLVESTGLAGPEVVEAATTSEAVDLLEQQGGDVAFVEIQPVSQGLETIAVLRNLSSGLRIVVCSFHGNAATKELALARGADAYLDKPVSSFSLTRLLRGFFSEPASMPDAPSPDDTPPPVPVALGQARRRP